VALQAFEDHGLDDVDDGGFEVGFEEALAFAVECGGVGKVLGEEVADAEDDAVDGGDAGSVEVDAALIEELVEAGGDEALEEGELVGVVGVEGGAVDGGGVGDVLDGDLFELFCFEELIEGLLEELAGAADARVEGLTGGGLAGGFGGSGQRVSDCISHGRVLDY
jgi:hypothetical protein